MNRTLKKDQILTMPNLLSIIRLILILFSEVPDPIANMLILLCIAVMSYSFVRYAQFYKKLLFGGGK